MQIITQVAFNEMRECFTERYYYALEQKAGGKEALLAMTAGKPREQVEFILDSFFPEGEANTGLIDSACRYLLDQELLFDALEVQPLGEDT